MVGHKALLSGSSWWTTMASSAAVASRLASARCRRTSCLKTCPKWLGSCRCATRPGVSAGLGILAEKCWKKSGALEFPGRFKSHPIELVLSLMFYCISFGFFLDFWYVLIMEGYLKWLLILDGWLLKKQPSIPADPVRSTQLIPWLVVTFGWVWSWVNYYVISCLFPPGGF